MKNRPPQFVCWLPEYFSTDQIHEIMADYVMFDWMVGEVYSVATRRVNGLVFDLPEGFEVSARDIDFTKVTWATA